MITKPDQIITVKLSALEVKGFSLAIIQLVKAKKLNTFQAKYILAIMNEINEGVNIADLSNQK